MIREPALNETAGERKLGTINPIPIRTAIFDEDIGVAKRQAVEERMEEGSGERIEIVSWLKRAASLGI